VFGFTTYCEADVPTVRLTSLQSSMSTRSAYQVYCVNGRIHSSFEHNIVARKKQKETIMNKIHWHRPRTVKSLNNVRTNTEFIQRSDYFSREPISSRDIATLSVICIYNINRSRKVAKLIMRCYIRIRVYTISRLN